MTDRRSLWLSIAALTYVCFGAMGSAAGWLVPIIAFASACVVLLEVWRRTSARTPDEQRVEPAARGALRACFWGAAIWVVSRTGSSGRPALDTAANIGAGVSSVAALVALSRVASVGGQLKAHPSTRSWDAAIFAALGWAVAVAIPGTRAFVPSTELLLDPLAIDYATTTAALGSLFLLIAVTWRLRIMRRLELGVGDRAAGALALSLTAVCVGIPAAAADIAAPDRALPLALIAASVACTWTATTVEPTTVSTVLRGTLAVMMLGVPTTLTVAVVARAAPGQAGPVALIGCAVSIVVGLIARAVARPLGPEQSRWLEAFESASRSALQPEPDAAIRAALVSLRTIARTPDAKPELWRVSPAEVLSVDVAGYLHIHRAEAPARLYEVAMTEPERTLRAEVLEALRVRRPDLRPLLRWFETHRAFSATIVVDEDGPIGLLLLPRGTRTRPMTLEEARGARLLADRISALLAVSSALARSREREVDAERRAEAAESEQTRLERLVTHESERNRGLAEILARPIRTTAYGAASRMAIEDLRKRGSAGTPLCLHSPTGVDATGWAAIAHLESPRKGGPFVVVRGTSGAERTMDRWENSRSPIEIADGGTLFVQDIQALPHDVQDAIVRLLTRKATLSGGGAVPTTGLIASVREPLSALARTQRVSKALVSLLKDSVDLPPLSGRGEDLRAIILDHLAAAGARRRGDPLGVDPRALQLLLDHTWPGNDGELSDVLTRAAEIARGPVVTAADLAAIGFRPSVDPQSTATPLPIAVRRRLRPRAAPRRR
jgi:hypothetical protein